jgi:peptidoglycan/LPS O-acetylase OafA/YrhL
LLGHAWSLAIEEQFYAIWPPLLLLLVRMVRRRWALLLIVVAAVGLAVAYRFTIMSTWAAVASAVVIVAALLPSSPCGDLLGWAPLTWLGRRSYALYHWHYPVFYVAGPLWKPEAHPMAVLLAWLVTFALAAASFRYIEQPVLNLKATLAARRADAAAWPSAASAPLAAPARLGRS